MHRPGPSAVGRNLFRSLFFLTPESLRAAHDEAKFRMERSKITREEFRLVLEQLRRLGWDPEARAAIPLAEPQSWQILYRCKICNESFLRPIPSTFRTARDAYDALARQLRARRPIHANEVEGSRCFGIAEVMGLDRAAVKEKPGDG